MGFKVTGDLEVTGAVKIGADTLTATGAELNFVDGVKSAIQTQIDGKAGLTNWGNPEGGYLFDGVDDYVIVADNANLDFGTGDFSMVGSFRTGSDVTLTRVLLEKREATIRNSLYIDGGLLNWYVVSTGNILITTSMVANTNYHFAVVLNRTANTATLYINGISVATDNSVSDVLTVSNTGDLIIGKAGLSSEYYHNGLIYSTRLFNRALTASEVTKLYNNGRPDLASLDYADLGASQVLLESSDFSSDTNNYNNANNSAVAGNVDGVSGVDDCLSVTVTSTGTTSTAKVNNLTSGNLLQNGKSYIVSFDAYTDNANSFTQILFRNGAGDAIDATEGVGVIPLTKGAWTTYTRTYSNISGLTNGLFRWFTYGGLTNEVIYFKNIQWKQIGCVAEYLPKHAGHYTWIETQNGLHGTATGGVTPLSNKIGDTRTAYLLTTSTSPTMTDVIKAGWKVESITMTSAENLTEIDATQETSTTELLTNKANNAGTITWTPADHNIYPTADKDLVFKITGNGGAGTHIYVNLKKII